MTYDFDYLTQQAALALEGVVDKQGVPLIEHSERVRDRVALLSDPDVAAAALFHDVLEDTPYTREDLLNLGLSERAVEIVEAVSREEGEVYMDFIARAARHPYGKLVKLADVYDHVDPTLNRPIPDYMMQRYARTIPVLEKAAGYSTLLIHRLMDTE